MASIFNTSRIWRIVDSKQRNLYRKPNSSSLGDDDRAFFCLKHFDYPSPNFHRGNLICRNLTYFWTSRISVPKRSKVHLRQTVETTTKYICFLKMWYSSVRHLWETEATLSPHIKFVSKKCVQSSSTRSSPSPKVYKRLDPRLNLQPLHGHFAHLSLIFTGAKSANFGQ